MLTKLVGKGELGSSVVEKTWGEFALYFKKESLR